MPASLAWLGTGLTYGIPNALLLFVPLAILVMFTLRRTGFGRLLYAVGDNERATRIAGVLYWQVILALYVVSALIAGIAGLLYVGLIKAPSLSLAEPLLLPSVAAAVIGGTSIFGGRGGYAGTIVGALILTVLATLLTVLHMPEGSRRILFGLLILAVTAAYLRITEEVVIRLTLQRSGKSLADFGARHTRIRLSFGGPASPEAPQTMDGAQERTRTFTPRGTRT